MLNCLRFIYLFSLGVWLGTIVFHSFVVAPTMFSHFAPQMAGDVVSRLFPRYYRVGFLCGAVCTVVPLLLFGVTRSSSSWLIVASLGAAMWGLTLVAGTVVHHRAAALRAEIRDAATATEEQRVAFARWHRAAVLLNFAVLATGLGVTWLVARKME